MIGVKSSHYMQENPLPDLLCTDYILSGGGGLAVDDKKSNMSASLSPTYFDEAADCDKNHSTNNRSGVTSGQLYKEKGVEMSDDATCNFRSAKALFEKLERQNRTDRSSGAKGTFDDELSNIAHSKVSKTVQAFPIRSGLAASSSAVDGAADGKKTSNFPVRTVAYLTPKTPPPSSVQNVASFASPPMPPPKPRNSSLTDDASDDMCYLDMATKLRSTTASHHNVMSPPSSHIFSAVEKLNQIYSETPTPASSASEGLLRQEGYEATASSLSEGNNFSNDASIAELTKEFNKVVSQIESANSQNATDREDRFMVSSPKSYVADREAKALNDGYDDSNGSPSAASVDTSSSSFFAIRQSPCVVRRSFLTSPVTDRDGSVGVGLLSNKNAVSCDRFPPESSSSSSSLELSSTRRPFMTPSCSLEQLAFCRQQPNPPTRPSCLLTDTSPCSQSSPISSSSTTGSSSTTSTAIITSPTPRTYEPYWRHHAWYSRRYGLDSLSRFTSTTLPVSGVQSSSVTATTSSITHEENRPQVTSTEAIGVATNAAKVAADDFRHLNKAVDDGGQVKRFEESSSPMLPTTSSLELGYVRFALSRHSFKSL
ncbi:unnamed protein product [Soboliphyme baturini]|uniref:SH2 domain-containing protein n=1 Tax=Soboliphyme baturini TaxID=241478 RepID=A0A183J695_9BILA|nr:unnamed protein product [Soboliphyme baturini]